MANAHAALVDELRHALNRLSDSASLGQSPLIQRFGLENREDPAVALRTLLIEGIAALRPACGSRGDAADRRRYQILFERYVEERTQQVVASRLGITPRHLRREQTAALGAFARLLDLQYELGAGSGVELGTLGQSPHLTRHTEVNREMLWLADAHRHETSDVVPVLREVEDLAHGLASDGDIGLHVSCECEALKADIPRTVLRQVVLNLLTAGVQNLERGGRIQVDAREGDGRALITVTVRRERGSGWRDLDALGKAADVSRQLVELFGGYLTISTMDDLLLATVSLAGVDRQVRVLSIDDNADTLRLWRRYVERTRFTLIEESDPDQALRRAAKLQPALIVLDVMLPGVDGWELLRQFRQHVATAGIPIIVCTVLPQRQLALSLGAADFIQKPVTGREFRAALERQTAAVERRE